MPFLAKLALTVALTLMLSLDLSAATFPLPPANVDIVGKLYVVKTRHEDTLAQVAREFNLGHEAIVNANPEIDRWIPGEGTEVVLPTRFILPDAPRKGVVVNLPEMRLYYYPKPKKGETPVVITHPVSVGRMDWATPLGDAKIVKKQKDPPWFPPESIRAEHEAKGDPLPKRVPPGPENPLGQFALRLSIPGYLIHGTNRPYGIGMRVTHGCIRMYPEDIESIFSQIPLGTPVRFVNQPAKAALLADTLFLEVHPALEESPLSEDKVLQVAMSAIERAAGSSYPGLSEERAYSAVSRAAGIPEVVSFPAGE
jgi:L,D-transpeptidase ErfK/SrfK